MTHPTQCTGDLPDRSALWRIGLPHSPSAVPLARAMVRDVLAELGQASGPDTDTAELLTAEVVTNAVEHTDSGPIELSVELLPQGFQVEVHDPGHEVPYALTSVDPSNPLMPSQQAQMDQEVPRIEDLAENGRGLLLIRALSSDSGCRLTGTGKAVWFTLR
ncbi:ATP-binding protein [Streptomyces sp. CA-111067]|uniref:ATP-binding protein n=1 Tax=Streptomyces sp. CA-111067 TaxID=3240046 RepID=UPI003D964378